MLFYFVFLFFSALLLLSFPGRRLPSQSDTCFRRRRKDLATCPRLRPDIPFVLAAWLMFLDFSFLFRYFAWKRIFEGFFLSHALFLIFSTALLLLVFSLSFAGFAEGYHLG